jgi:hypothetical protein
MVNTLRCRNRKQLYELNSSSSGNKGKNQQMALHKKNIYQLEERGYITGEKSLPVIHLIRD